MISTIGILAGLICLVSVVIWLGTLILKKQNLRKAWSKVILISACLFLACGVITLSTHKNSSKKSSSSKSNATKVVKNKKSVHKKGDNTDYDLVKVYPVNVQSAKVNNDGDLVIKGTSAAPDGAKILAESNTKYSDGENEASPTDLDNDGYDKVKNGKFDVTLDVSSLYDSDNLKVGQKLKPIIFAVTGYKVKFDDYKITSKLKEKVKEKNISPFVYAATAKMCKEMNDDSDNSSSSKSSSSSKKAGMTKSEKIAVALTILKKNYKGKADVEYNSSDNMFTILPTMGGYRDIIKEAIDGDTDNWDTVTDSIDEVSQSLYEDVKLKVPVSLVNPDNKSKVLYTSIDGLGSYDFTDDN